MPVQKITCAYLKAELTWISTITNSRNPQHLYWNTESHAHMCVCADTLGTEVCPGNRTQFQIQ